MGVSSKFFIDTRASNTFLFNVNTTGAILTSLLTAKENIEPLHLYILTFYHLHPNILLFAHPHVVTFLQSYVFITFNIRNSLFVRMQNNMDDIDWQIYYQIPLILSVHLIS